MIVTVTIPAVIARQVSPNYTPATKAGLMHQRRLQHELKDTTILSCQGAGLHLGHGLTPPIALSYTVARGRRRQPMDDDNLKASLKYVQDGIAHALAIDDKHMTVTTVEQVRDLDGIGYIDVTIESGGTHE